MTFFLIIICSKHRFLVSLSINNQLNNYFMNTVKEAVATEKNPKTLNLVNEVKTAEDAKKTAVLEQLEKFKPTPILSADERIERIRHFDALSERYKFLKNKSNDLKMFDAGNDKTNAKVNLENAQGFKFTVQNSNVIDKVTATMRAELNVLLIEAESEILTFEI